MEKLKHDTNSISYIDDLSVANYKSYITELRKNINKVMTICNLNLSSASKLIGISRVTLRRFLIAACGESLFIDITFTTASKFNNFIYKIYEEYNKSLTC